ncbi:hypothetical protein BD311DRAFT_811430 [Dichomitus squalens]|uniref:Uncharacterized protein n=1 Tax=Dichomitus squalens TaxID=114155 RepID=A0A4Q9M6D8_9APHY|nr:hypothetical protein BD311DRAFT_811430 [Dichomitus squalens]
MRSPTTALPHSRADNDGRIPIKPQSLNAAVQAIVHARKYAIHGVLKRAFYELLRSPAFWDAVTHERAHVRAAHQRAEDPALLAGLEDADIRHGVQALPGAWRPGRQEAPAAWAVDIARGPHILSSSCEAIMQTHAVQQWLEGLKRQSEHEWCATCLDERIRVWEGARIAWWARLDAWLETGVGVGVSVAQMNVDMHAAFGGEIPI